MLAVGPQLRCVALYEDGCCRATFEDESSVTLSPGATTFALESPTLGSVRQLTSCCVRAHAPLVARALEYRNRLADVPAIHWHLLSDEQRAACVPDPGGPAVARWPTRLDAAVVGTDGAVRVSSLDLNAELVLSPSGGHVRVEFLAPVLRLPPLSGTRTPHAAPEPPTRMWWVQVFAAESTPQSWQHALELALARAAAEASALGAADGAERGEPCAHAVDACSPAWSPRTVELLAGLEAPGGEARIAARIAGGEAPDLSLPDGQHVVTAALAVPLSAARGFEPTSTASRVRVELRADALYTRRPEPGARPDAGGLDVLLLHDDSWLQLERAGRVWTHRSARGGGGPAHFAAGAVPAVVGEGGSRLALGSIAAAGERMLSARAHSSVRAALAAVSSAGTAAEPSALLERVHEVSERAARSKLVVAESYVEGVGQLVAYADGHTLGRFDDRTIVTLHAPAEPATPLEDRRVHAVMPDGRSVHARAGRPIGVEEYVLVLARFDAWAQASPEARAQHQQLEAARQAAIQVALRSTERMLRVHAVALPMHAR